MNPDRFARLKKILLEVSDLTEQDRSAYLDDACGDDPELRLEAEAILLESQQLAIELEDADSSYTLDIVKVLVELYDSWSKPEKTAEWRRKLPEPAAPE